MLGTCDLKFFLLNMVQNKDPLFAESNNYQQFFYLFWQKLNLVEIVKISQLIPIGVIPQNLVLLLFPPTMI